MQETNNNKKLNILIVDDYKPDQIRYSRYLNKAESFTPNIMVSSNIQEASLQLQKESKIQCILLDYQLPDGNGLDFITANSKKFQEIPVIILTGEGDERIAVEAMKHGADDYLVKDVITPQILSKSIEQSLERCQLRLELEQKRKIAVQASQFKTEFLARMSHEIRTPLNSIIGMNDLLKESNLPEELRGYVEGIDNSSESLLNIINDILDISKIEAGEMNIDESEFELEGMLLDCINILAIQAEKRKNQLFIKSMPNLSNPIIGDIVRIKQVIINFLSNATKFTKHGEIYLECKSQNSELEFSVSDSGIGIPKNKLNKIFESYKQAESSTSRDYGGTGLGLSICKKLVEMMNGRIWVESSEGSGSKFSFTIPHKKSSVKITKNIETIGKAFKALIIDEIEGDSKFLESIMNDLGYITTVCNSPLSAIKLIKNNTYNNLFIASQMFQMDGFSLLETAEKETPGTKSKSIMMLSIGERKTHIKKIKTQNIGNYFVKPFGLDIVLASLNKLKKGAQQEKNELNDKLDFSKLNILIVEDNHTNQNMMLMYGKVLGFSSDFANNGKEALEILEFKTYDIVFMDMQMPIMSGVEATRKIRELQKDKNFNTPIIGLSANALKGQITEAIDAGMTDYLTKPIRKPSLIKTLLKYCGDKVRK